MNSPLIAHFRVVMGKKKSKKKWQQRVWGHCGVISDVSIPDPAPLGAGSGMLMSAIAP